MKPLAPYGKFIQQNNPFHAAIIFIGKVAIERAEQFQAILPYTLCLPYPDSPSNYFWPLDNCDVYLVDTGQSKDSFIQYCALTFFGYGANVVRYISAKRVLILERELNHEPG